MTTEKVYRLPAPFTPEDWQPSLLIDFVGEGARLSKSGCFIPFVSNRAKVGDRVEFRIEKHGPWGERITGGGMIQSVKRGVGTDVPGIVIDFLFLSPACREGVLFACTQQEVF